MTPLDSPSPPSDDTLIARLAARVRARRKAMGLPRRVLSERSGVSPRYLAQLESGEGNISVLLLERVAQGLDCRVSDLITEDEDTLLDPDVQRVAGLYAAAPDHVQGRVRALLAPDIPAVLRAQRICLIGLRGAGKSTLGEAAADKLGIPFVELNQRIETAAGMPISEIISLYGQEGFRQMQAEQLRAIVESEKKLILAVGGGIVGDEDTYGVVLERFFAIWLRTSPAEHMARVRQQGDLRPMQGHPQAMDQLKAFLTARTPQYERAAAQIDTSNKPVSSSVNDLLAVIAKHGCLDRTPR